MSLIKLFVFTFIILGTVICTVAQDGTNTAKTVGQVTTFPPVAPEENQTAETGTSLPTAESSANSTSNDTIVTAVTPEANVTDQPSENNTATEPTISSSSTITTQAASKTTTTETNQTSTPSVAEETTRTPTQTTSNSTESDNSTEIISPTTQPTETTSSTTAQTTSSSTPPSVKPHVVTNSTVKISETNLLLTDTDFFIELRGDNDEDTTGLYLVVVDASSGALVVEKELGTNFDDSGLQLLKNDSILGLDKVHGLTAVFIGLYQNKTDADSLTTVGLLDLLLFSYDGNLDSSLQEKFSTFAKYPLVIDFSKLSSIDNLSLTRCTNTISNGGFVLLPATPGTEGDCNLDTTIKLGMWLSGSNKPCPEELSENFKADLISQLITKINSRNQCGLSRPMLELNDDDINKKCETTTKTRVDVNFHVKAAFEQHLSLVVEGYTSFVEDPSLEVAGVEYQLHNCTSCVMPAVNPRDDSKKDIQVTVGVVLTCVAIFLVVLLLVILYLKKKRRGILQFRMTRLDEDDDDMLGDMDDFVGNQGPTFRNFR